jgi:hypothetical protein
MNNDTYYRKADIEQVVIKKVQAFLFSRFLSDELSTSKAKRILSKHLYFLIRFCY